jgi:hypothetical protein
MTDATTFDYSGPRTPQGTPIVTIHPAPKPGNPRATASPTPNATPPDPWAAAGFDLNPPQESGTGGDDPWNAAGFTDTPPAPQRQVGTGEAFARGTADVASIGTAPLIAGLDEAGKATAQADPALAATTQPAGLSRGGDIPALTPILGAANMFKDWVTGHPDPAINDAFEKGRQDALDSNKAAYDQHKAAYIGGQLFGSLLMPTMGAAAPGAFVARATRGAIAGGAGAGAYAAGSGASQERPLPEIAADTAVAIPEGMVLGGLSGGVLGPRAPRAPRVPVTPGEQAAATSAALGAPLPRGVSSDSRAARSITAASASIPLMGARVRNAVDATREAAGNVIQNSGIDEAINANRQRINGLYDAVRGQINPDQVMPMRQTAGAVARIRARRAAARQPNPDQGLEQFDNIANQGASFNGAHRARVDAREAGDAVNPHPGYNAADYNAITRAMTGDIRVNLAQQGGRRALAAFDRAEEQFGPISEANKFLSRIARQRGPGAGLDEIGFNPATGEFSLDKFVTAWNKINPQSRPFVPEPGHANNIDAIFQMGTHIKSSLRERNTSHTSTPLIMWDLARDAIMTGAAVATGIMSSASVLGSAAAAMPAVVLMHWLSSPPRAAAMAAWSRAYRVFLTNPTPARIGVLTIAARNMANTLGLDPAAVVRQIRGTVAGQAEPEDQSRTKH